MPAPSPHPLRKRWIWALLPLSLLLLVVLGVQRRSREREDARAWVETMYAAGFQIVEDRPLLLSARAVLDEFLESRGEWWMITIRDDDEVGKLTSLSPQLPRRLNIAIRASVSDAAVEQLRLQYPTTQIATAGAYQDGEVQPGR